MTAPLRILIEGPNYAGKSSLSSHLRLLLPGSSIIELHDFCHQHIIRLSQDPMTLSSREEYGALRSSFVLEAQEYLRLRERAVLDMIDALSFDSIIIERLSLTQFVYFKLLFGVDCSSELRRLDEELAKRRVFLILINARPDILIARSRATVRKRSGHHDYGIPYHLSEQESIAQKGSLYDLGYGEMTKIRKTRIDTSTLDEATLNIQIQKAVQEAALLS